MISSILSRGQGTSSSGLSTSLIEFGIFQSALRQAAAQYPACAEYLNSTLITSLDAVSPLLSDASNDTQLPLDRFSVGNALLFAESDGLSGLTFADTSSTLLLSQALQPRNYLGGYWYYIYPQWSYLDGMYSLAPWDAHNALLDVSNTTEATSRVQDLNLQLSLLYSHCLHSDTSLMVHGYDASKTATWANPDSGASRFVWGRSMAWYLMALVESLGLLGTSTALQSTPQYNFILGILLTLAGGVVRAADISSGAWWQMMEFPNRQANYLESSATNLFIYALLKAVRLGLIVDGNGAVYAAAAQKAYAYTLANFVVANANGTMDWNGTVSVCSLNSTASYEYYTSQPILWDSLIGTSAFVLSSLEIEKLSGS